MGMDYQYAGSASYPRFDRELEEIAKLFGGKLTSELGELKELLESNSNTISGFIDYMFGYISNADDAATKFVFPPEIHSTFRKWINHPYSDLWADETLVVYNILKSKESEVRAISGQIMDEFETLVELRGNWHIC